MESMAQEYLRQPYARILIPDEHGTYSAEIMEFPGCFAQGESADEAMKNLDIAAVAWIEVAVSQGQEIPKPSINQGYGGKVALRLPRSIHRRSTELAQRDGTSLNQFLVAAIAEKIGAEDLYGRIVRRMETHLAVAPPRTTSISLIMHSWILDRQTGQSILSLPGKPNAMFFDRFASTIERLGEEK